MGGRVVVLVSGDGSLLQSLLDAADSAATAPSAPTAHADAPSADADPIAPNAEPAMARVVGVVADRPGIRALERATVAGVPTTVVDPGEHPDRRQWDLALAEAAAAHRPDLVLLAGFNRLVGPAFLGRFGGRVLNSHPALLPSFPGLHAVRDALAHGVKVTGATLFVVDAGTDTGPVIAQVAVPVYEDDTEASLHERIKQAERATLPGHVARLAVAGFTVHGRKVHIP